MGICYRTVQEGLGSADKIRATHRSRRKEEGKLERTIVKRLVYRVRLLPCLPVLFCAFCT